MAMTTQHSVRLTRRGRVVIVTLLALMVAVAFMIGRSGGSASAATEHEATLRPYAQTTVEPGETLWAVAKRVAPHADPRSVVEQIESLNHLSGGGLQVGQQLLLPHTT